MLRDFTGADNVYTAWGYTDLRRGIVYNQLHKDLIGNDILHADETTLQVIHELGKKPRARATCGFTGQAEMLSILLFCMSTSLTGVHVIQKFSEWIHRLLTYRRLFGVS